MKYQAKEIKGKPIIGGHRIPEVMQDPEIIPFLPCINTSKKESHVAVLRRWMNHFIEKDIPFVVIEHTKHKYSSKLQLWKNGIDT